MCAVSENETRCFDIDVILICERNQCAATQKSLKINPYAVFTYYLIFILFQKSFLYLLLF